MDFQNFDFLKYLSISSSESIKSLEIASGYFEIIMKDTHTHRELMFLGKGLKLYRKCSHMTSYRFLLKHQSY